MLYLGNVSYMRNFLHRVWKIGPALATGCTIVMKPSEITPLTALVRHLASVFLNHSGRYINPFLHSETIRTHQRGWVSLRKNKYIHRSLRMI